MTAINFPDTPDDNDEFTSGDRTWKWNDTADVGSDKVTTITQGTGNVSWS